MAGARHGSLPGQMLNQTTYEPQQEEVHNGSHEPSLNVNDASTALPPKRRPWSSEGIKSMLSPSPTIIENRRGSKDDSDIPSNPVTPKRPHHPPRGLTLQMPPRDLSSTSTANLSKRIPVSPKLDCSAAYPSPASVLPRRSRGLDFSRAATNLHHSVLAEQPSPESSPTVGGRRGINIPVRKGLSSPLDSSNIAESPRNMHGSLWTTLSNGQRAGLSSSVGSSAVVENDSGSSSSDETMDLGEDDDTIQMTPLNGLSLVNPFGPMGSSPGGDGVGIFTPSTSKLISYQRARLQSRRNRTRGSSSSASGQSTMQSPVPPSPPPVRSLESSMSMNGGYFLDEPTKKEIGSRRESLSLGTTDMHLSDAEQSEDEGHLQVNTHEHVPVPAHVTPSMEDRKQVVRKAVTRRSNLLPKSRGFARIKAALLEEGAPIDTDLRREAEVIKQVRESDIDGDLSLQPSQPTTSASSPSLGPVTAGPTENIEVISSDLSTSSEESMRRRSSSAFTNQAARCSGGISFWKKFDERMRTPPPPLLSRASSSGIGEDVNMDSMQPSTLSMAVQQNGTSKAFSQDTASSTPLAVATATFEIPKKGNKRMRDDDFDPNYFKRRAVSPGLSVQNSPVLPQSPGWWGTPKREERVSSNGSVGSGNGTGKRVGLQGMNDTNDGLMNMSIE
ncbi:MAG: hypothetical protein Q9217_001068 [Psora testacea]